MKKTALILTGVFLASGLFVYMCGKSNKASNNNPNDNLPPSPIAPGPVKDCSISIISMTNSPINLGYTQKVVDGPYVDAINNAKNIVIEMTQKLSFEAKAAINKTMVEVYHCDPSGETGMIADGHDTYDLQKYDYLTQLEPACTYYKKQGAMTDKSYGFGVPDNAFIAGKCQTGFSPVCAVTSVCDVNLVDTQNALEQDKLKDEVVLVKEFGHTILNVALQNGNQDEQVRAAKIIQAYKDIYLENKSFCPQKEKSTNEACHSASDMWGIATQTWFGSRTNNQDNNGINTVKEINENIAVLIPPLTFTYGNLNGEFKKIYPYNGKPKPEPMPIVKFGDSAKINNSKGCVIAVDDLSVTVCRIFQVDVEQSLICGEASYIPFGTEPEISILDQNDIRAKCDANVSEQLCEFDTKEHICVYPHAGYWPDCEFDEPYPGTPEKPVDNPDQCGNFECKIYERNRIHTSCTCDPKHPVCPLDLKGRDEGVCKINTNLVGTMKACPAHWPMQNPS